MFKHLKITTYPTNIPVRNSWFRHLGCTVKNLPVLVARISSLERWILVSSDPRHLRVRVLYSQGVKPGQTSNTCYFESTFTCNRKNLLDNLRILDGGLSLYGDSVPP